MRAIFLVILVLGVLSCRPANRVVVDDAPSLPKAVFGASDPYIAQLQQKLSKRGVRVISMGQMYLISVPSALIFADQSPRLHWASYDLLNDIVCYLRQFRKVAVHVNAYTSCYRSRERTRALSLARARTIAEYLWLQNVKTRLMFTQGMGDGNPISTLDKCTDSSPNSRIEIIFRRAIV